MNDIQLLTQTADFIVKYGFLAVGLVLIGLIAPVIYKFSEAKLIALATLCFGLAFVIAYGVLGILTIVAPSWVSAQRVMLIGIIRNVPNGKTTQIQSDLWEVGHAFIKREHDRQADNLFDFRFVLLTERAPSCLEIGLVSTDPHSDDSALFTVAPISDADMAADIQLVAQVGGEPDAPALSFWREQKNRRLGAPLTLQPSKGTEPGCARVRTASAPWSLFGLALAQPAPTADLTAKLQSDDVFTRRDARIALSKKTDDDLKLLASLVARDDNYRLQLGAVVALADVPDELRKKAPAGLFDKVRSLRNSSDKTMRDAAVLALREPAFCYQEINTARKPEERYIVLCHWAKEQCEKTRGPNTSAGVTQSACVPVDVAEAKWKYTPGGTGGAWYQYSATAVGAPFPAVQAR